MKFVFVFIFVFICIGNTAFADQAVNKVRKENPEQWTKCKNDYNGYISLIKNKIKENKQLSGSDLKEIEKTVTPNIESIYSCNLGGYYDSEDMELNMERGGLCLNQFRTLPKAAKNTTECKAISNASLLK